MRPTAKNTLTASLAMVIAAAMSPTITTNLAIVFRCSHVMMTKMLVAMTIEQRSASVAVVAAAHCLRALPHAQTLATLLVCKNHHSPFTTHH